MLSLSAWLWIAAPPATEPEPPESTLTQQDRGYQRERTTLGITGMATLTGWAVANIAGGLAGNFTSEGTLRYFHQGNAAWNSVNLVLGVIGLVGQVRERRHPVSLAAGLSAARKAQLAFVINGALDVLYIGAGAATWQLAEGRSPRFTGYGQALVLQGAFLFVFDFAMAWAHERQINRVSGRGRPLAVLPSVAPSLGGLSLGVQGQF